MVTAQARERDYRDFIPVYTMQPDNQSLTELYTAGLRKGTGAADDGEVGEQIPEYLREGYRALMKDDGYRAIELWTSLYERYPSAEVCGHLARAHYYQIYFLGHDTDPVRHLEHVREMREWAERALLLNPNSSIGHAMLAGALGREAQLSGSQKQVILSAYQVQHHAERAVVIDNNWIGHYILAMWHREIASLSNGLRLLAQILHGKKLPKGSYDKSFAHFREVLRQFPGNNVIYAEMACSYYQMGDMENTKKMYLKCVSLPLFKHPVSKFFINKVRKQFDPLFPNQNGPGQNGSTE